MMNILLLQREKMMKWIKCNDRSDYPVADCMIGNKEFVNVVGYVRGIVMSVIYEPSSHILDCCNLGLDLPADLMSHWMPWPDPPEDEEKKRHADDKFPNEACRQMTKQIEECIIRYHGNNPE